MKKFLNARRRPRGFTLVEMVIVIVITGIIGACLLYTSDAADE